MHIARVRLWNCIDPRLHERSLHGLTLQQFLKAGMLFGMNVEAFARPSSRLLGRVSWLALALSVLHCSGSAGNDSSYETTSDASPGGASSTVTSSTTAGDGGTGVEPTDASSAVTTSGGETITSAASGTETTSSSSVGGATSGTSDAGSGFGGTTTTGIAVNSSGGASSTGDGTTTGGGGSLGNDNTTGDGSTTGDTSTTGGMSGADWLSDYTATMFGQADCSQWGFSDGTNLNAAACVSTGAVSLNGENQTWFGAPGDLATIWSGPACTCQGGQNADPCPSPPSCNMQDTCAQCFEVRCDPDGMYSYMNDGFTHNEFCRTDQSVVIQVIDACPHNHPNNNYWCTSQRPNHIDISCSAFRALTIDENNGGRVVGDIGSINAQVRPVDCSVGLGIKQL